MIIFDKISKSYRGPHGSVDVLKGATFAVKAGEFVGVRGASGCGKSTLLLIAGALLQPTSGTVAVNGHDPHAMKAGDRGRFRATSVGFVFQQFFLLPYLSVYENVLSANTPLGRSDAMERARQLLDRFGLTARADHLPGQLSAGEQQRTALARATLNRPSVLLADEPTGNLDDENSGIVLDFFAEFARDGGAVLMVTHDGQAAARATHVLELVDGLIQPAS